MKRIITLLTLIFSAVILSLTLSNAVLVEKTMDFSILSRETLSSYDRRYISNVGEDLYSKLADFTGWGEDFDNQGNPHYVTIKKGPLTYNGRISHRFHSLWDIHMYTIGIEYIPGSWASLEVYPRDFIIPFSSPINVNIGYAHFSHSPGLDGLGNVDIIGNYSIFAMLEGEIESDDGINVSSDFNLIPSTLGTLENAKTSTDVGYVYFIYNSDDLFETYIILGGVQYNLGLIELPGVSELNQMPLSPGIYWTENNKRHIYYEFQQPASVKPISEQFNAFLDDPTQIKGFRPFVTMNLTDSTYTFTDKLELYAGFYGGQNGQAYADVVFPFEIDKLLSIEIDYQYRWQILWGLSYTSWTDVNITRYIDQVVDMRSTWQHVTRLITGFSVGLMSTAVSGWDSTIEEIQVNSIYRSDYVDNINKVRLSQGKTALTQSQVFPANADIFRVYLDTFSDGRYTGYEINDDIVIVDVMYEVDGTIYHVGYEDIKQGGSFGGGGPGLGGQDQPKWDWSFITSIFENIPIEYLVIGLFALYVVFYKPINSIFKNIKKIISNPKELLIFAILVGGLLFYMGYL